MDLGKATVALFAEHVDSRFHVVLDTGEIVEIELIEAEPYGAGVSRHGSPPPREPFSLLFSAPPDTPLPQRIYPIEHDALGPFELFLTPVGPGRLEAVFN